MKDAARILIVEDELVLQDVYRLVLTTKGYKVYTANNGLEGLSQAKNVHPDLILLDMFMPVMDGREFLRNFDSEIIPNAKIIVFTNLSDQTYRQEMLELGATDFILKSSMAPNDLLELVAKHLPA